MVSKNRVYVIGRNARGGAALQHRVPDHVATITCCGVNIDEWSRSYLTRRLGAILCKRNQCRG